MSLRDTIARREFIKYATQAGFDPRLCYGDVTLRFLFKGEYQVKGQVGAEEVPEVEAVGIESSV